MLAHNAQRGQYPRLPSRALPILAMELPCSAPRATETLQSDVWLAAQHCGEG